MPSTSAALFTARALVDELVRGGVEHACVAPGSRSTPLALALAERDDITSRVMTDERSMGFFALGLARADAKPVALVCTSGTAAANFLPAVAEAALGGGALVLLTADRPPELRDCAAPQTIDQVGMFGSHARWAVDVPLLDADEMAARVLRSLASRAVATATAGASGPVHLNVPFREPFFDGSFPSATTFDLGARRDRRPFTEVLVTIAPQHETLRSVSPRDALFRSEGVLSRRDARPGKWDADRSDDARHRSLSLETLVARLSAAERGVIVCAGREVPADDVAELASALGWPILADPLCGLRFGAHDRSAVLDASEVLLRDDTLGATLKPDAIVRFGLTPAPRAMQRWLEAAWPAEHVVVAEDGWPDPMRSASVVVRAEPGAFCRATVAALSASPARNADPSDDGTSAPRSALEGTTGETPGAAIAAIASWRERWSSLADAARIALNAGLDAGDTLFDGQVLRSVAAALPEGATLVVGNSMPVRDADTFLAARSKRLRVFANRGASGIDGVLSTALGMASTATATTDAAKRNTTSNNAAATALVVGDLSFLHDVGALAFAVRERLPLLIVVVNNDGGGIFSYLPQRGLGEAFERFFGTPHGTDLEKAAGLLDGRFARVTTMAELDTTLVSALSAAASGPFLVEVCTDREAGRAAQLEIVDRAREAARLADSASLDSDHATSAWPTNTPPRTTPASTSDAAPRATTASPPDTAPSPKNAPPRAAAEPTSTPTRRPA
jgi:2-succinyl-5-enolpyruvyl-6-hydroxy-3-cyclohexene-1-carboxylate synthase